MKNLEIYAEDVLENGKLSALKLNEALKNYQENAVQVEKEARETGLTGDELADEFFNNLDEITLLSFETDTQHVDISLGRFHDFDEETGTSEFGVCYLVEERNLDLELENADDYLLGDEVAFISELKNIGYQE